MILSNYIYLFVFLLMSLGLYMMIAEQNLMRKLFGMSIFQTSVLLFYISLGYISNASIPILNESSILYSNPLPHVLMLTAIVVGVATLAVGLALAVRIDEEYGSSEEADILS